MLALIKTHTCPPPPHTHTPHPTQSMQDIELSQDVMRSFRQSPAATARLAAVAPGMDTSVTVLTNGFWPTYAMAECTLPAELSGAQQVQGGKRGRGGGGGIGE
jgi:hypothetical protein